jgi:hypothetical protein
LVELPPFQLYRSPPEAVTLIDGVVQLISVVPELFVREGTGGVVLEVIVMLDVAEQPFDPITFTVYVPDEVNELEAELGVFPPSHE